MEDTSEDGCAAVDEKQFGLIRSGWKPVAVGLFPELRRLVQSLQPVTNGIKPF